MLATEMYKVSINFSPPHVNEIFEISNEHSYKLKQKFSRPLVKSFYHGTESLSYLEPKVLRYTPKHLQKYKMV